MAAAAALGIAELLAGILSGVPSLIVAVGAAVIDAVPGWLERHAIAILGTADKPVLVGGVVVLTAFGGALLGMAATRSRWAGAAGVAAFAAVGAGAGVAYRDTQPLAAVLVAALSAATAILVMFLLLRRRPRPVAETVTRSQGDVSNLHGRRTFLAMSATAAALAAGAAVTGRWLADRKLTSARRLATVLPAAEGRVTVPPGADLEIEGLTPYIVANEDFYRIDTALRVPVVDVDKWSLSIDGFVDRPFHLAYDELLGMPQTEQVITLSCVSNEVGEGLVGNALWQGVRLRDLLEQAGVQPQGTQLVGKSVDGFTAGFPTELAVTIPDALVAVGMNGEPLPLEHGYPARLVVPGLYGYVSATKWLSEILLTDFEEFDAYWITRGWAKEGVIKTQSRIDVPRSGATVPSGTQTIAGVAWAPARGITAVQVSIDGGAWQPATLADRVDVDTWRQWFLRWDAPPGPHTLAVRAADATAEFQTMTRAPVFPSGATGHHTIKVQVT